MLDRHCETCRFWGAERVHDVEMPLGSCHALAPSIVTPQALAYHDPARPSASGPIVHRAEWPWTAFDDWCGQHCTKPNQTKTEAS